MRSGRPFSAACVTATLMVSEPEPRVIRPLEDLLRERFPEKSDAALRQLADEVRESLGVTIPDKASDTEDWQWWRDEAEKKKKNGYGLERD